MKRSGGIVLVMAMALVSLAAADRDRSREIARFVDDTHADFSAGTLDDGGHNLYVAKDGSLRTINRFDLNDDGHLDVLFSCTHNTYQMLPATAATVGADRKATSIDVAVEGSQQCVLADLNRDGYTDIVFCPNAIGVHHDRRFVMVAWGGADGWSASRINSPLPMNAAAKVEVADLNHDGWLDICVLGGVRWMAAQPDGRILRVYWGAETGFGITSFLDLGIVGALDLASADFDADGHRDLAVLRSDSRAMLLWKTTPGPGGGTKDSTEITLPRADSSCVVAADFTGDQRPDLVLGSSAAVLTTIAAQADRKWAEPVTTPAYPATQITVADLDNDQQADLALAQFAQSRAAGGEQAGAGKTAKDVIRVLWNDHGTFSTERVTNLAAPLAVATAAGDLDGDGRVDLAIAIHQGDATFNGTSFVYFGDGKRNFEKGAEHIKTSGTLHVAVAAAEKGLPARAVFCNSIGGQLDEAVPLHLFYGGKEGFDPERVWKIPMHSGYEGSAGDLNADGFADLIVLNSGHAGEHAHDDPTLGANILWGGPEGLEKSTSRTVLHEHFLGTSSIADLDRDGYLDLVLEPFSPEHDGETEKLIFYYGGPKGFEKARRKILPVEGYAQEHLVADVNRDGWLDVAVTTRKHDCIRIFWGSDKGFDVTREQRLNVSGPVGVDAADFNGDGWLDMLAGSYNDPVSGHRDMGLILFWGGAEGYRHSNSQWLPGFSPLGRTVADLDGDGFLDLVSPQHSGELTREDLACHIYWGSATGFATRRRTTFFADSVNDSMAGDFNGDGLIDLAVNCHTRHGDHRTQSRILYNDGHRFENPRIQKLPTNGPHLIWAEDLGNIYDRKYHQSFTSRTFEWKEKAASGKLTAKATMPPETRVTFDVRSAPTKEALVSSKWTAAKDGAFEVPADHRALQYRATLQSDNGDRYPIVERIDVSLAR